MKKVNRIFFVILIDVLLYGFKAFGQTLDPGHHVPLDKGLSAAWIKSLYANTRKPFTGGQLKTIGMPCGGIASGQLYVRGDGTLACWWIANDAYNTGYGHKTTNNFDTPLGPWKDCYQTFVPPSYVDEGFTINGRPLDKTGFDAIEFTGEYPVATIDYKDSKKPLPVSVHLQVFSPFIPLDARESATPGTVMQYTLKNISQTNQTVTLTGHLQNPVGIDGGKGPFSGTSRNKAFQEDGLCGVAMDLTNSNLYPLHPWNGNVCLSLIGDGQTSKDAAAPLGTKLLAEVGKTLTLKPGESRTLTFLVTWYFPNRPYPIDVPWTKPASTRGFVLGNNYANWFNSATDVARWLKNNLARLQSQTFAFHDAYYNHSTLPYWLNRRLMAPMSILASETVEWWSNGKFYAWEGVQSCIGNCTHVWNYEQGMAHLFPELDRNMREQNDLTTAMRGDGSILTRNDHPEFGVAIDGQCGAVLKAYREHLLSKDDIFLARNWPRIRAAMQFLVRMDQNADGIIDGTQGNTYDDNFYGANTYVGSLYLAALKATAQMGKAMHDPYGDTCAVIAKRGAENTTQRLYNGEYFIQEVDLKAHPDAQYGKGCLSDQLFGQTWASLYGLGNLYQSNEIKSSLNSIWKYNWAPDVSAQTKFHPAERDYASPGEAGLLICTWPHDPHPGDHGVRYRDEVWTGIEYQVATSMIYNDMLNEGLSLVKAVDDRYQPEKHNPWNEVECGDHYSRAMASWGVLLALCDFRYNGPQQSVGFSPKITPEHFSSFFSAAEGWGTISQERSVNHQSNTIKLVYGKLALKQLEVDLPENSKAAVLQLNNKTIRMETSQAGKRLRLQFDELTLKASDQLTVQTTY